MHKIKSGTAMAKAAFNNRKIFSQANCLKLKDETSKMLQLEHCAELGHFRKQISKTLKLLKCGAGEVRRSSAGLKM